MKAIRHFFHRSVGRATTSRFDRYYINVLRSGEGYPTADEARRDLRSYDRGQLYGWMR
ncbi:MAG: hypothetical protein ACRDJW_02215 [Thermomicrobiales bacterium]